MPEKAHEDPFPSPGLSARYVIRPETFARAPGSGGHAP